MDKTTRMNRKTATKLLLVQWSRFQNVCMRLEGSTLFTGVNGSGKSTILDAATYLLTGNTQFNKAAKDRDRTVLGYVRGDTRSNGDARYLRSGQVVSYIAMEFWSPVEQSSFVAGVCVESANEASQKSSWFLCRDVEMEQINFVRVEGSLLKITPRSELTAAGQPLKSSDFMGRDKGVEQIMRALGLRCDMGKYRSRLLKMMAFHPENNIDQFIQECVLDPGQVESLQELREQRSQFDRIRDVYENLQGSRARLKEVEHKSTEYEERLRKLRIKELMFCYQQLCGKREAQREMRLQQETLSQKQAVLEARKRELEMEYETAGERYRIAQNNDVLRGMKDTLDALERQLVLRNEQVAEREKQIAEGKRLQEQLQTILQWAGDEIAVLPEEKDCLCSLGEDGYGADRKIMVFQQFASMLRDRSRQYAREELQYENRIARLEQEIHDQTEIIRRLEANQQVFPRQIETAKKVIGRELERLNIHTEVRVFAELVQEVKEEAWQTAIETFLGGKRFHLIVEQKYCQTVLNIIRKRALHGVHVVMTDKLPDTQVMRGSAAEMLEIPNGSARRYANFLLNGIHLCASSEELHEHYRGGLMQDGMLARNCAISYMETERTECCLGSGAMEKRRKRAAAQKARFVEEMEQNRRQVVQIRSRRREVDAVDWDAGHYDFQAASRLKEDMAQRDGIQEKIEAVRDHPDFLTVLQEQTDARQAYDRIKDGLEQVNREIGACGTEMVSGEDVLKTISGEIYELEREYEEMCDRYGELKRPMLETYEKLRKQKENWQVMTSKAVSSLKSDVEACVRQLEDAQLRYCKMAGMDIGRRGVAYIPFFRTEYQEIANIRIEEASGKLARQAEKLENAFMNDFVAEINERMREAREEMEGINRELEQIPFGNDTYRFVMKPKPERAMFFRICKKLENYMNTPEIYMNSARDDEEMESDIRELMQVILEEEDETEYTDYRRYFTYDMEIMSRQGDSEVVAELSRKQGSASNGEKQTPYFIILAASLMQCYPRHVCCARLAFIDEAFSALSRERVEQMVRYLEDNHFQVFYAAPPEKISSIGTHVESTVSLIITGRYTSAVEGLAKNREIW